MQKNICAKNSSNVSDQVNIQNNRSMVITDIFIFLYFFKFFDYVVEKH